MLTAAAVIVVALLAVAVVTVEDGDDHYNSENDDDDKGVVGTHSEGGVCMARLDTSYPTLDGFRDGETAMEWIE